MYSVIDFFIHIDKHLVSMVSLYGEWSYLALFLVIFCETGLVITPFLPGDSLLFAAGAFAALPSQPLHLDILIFLLTIAAIAGNQVNYFFGRSIGVRALDWDDAWYFKKHYLYAAQQFYQHKGGLMLVMSRFLPIIRTFIPFIAGIASMPLRQFTFFNIISGALWIGSLLGGGFFLGSFPAIKNHFSMVIYMIVMITLLPPCITLLQAKLKK